jgi:ABC-type multidrug transport system fused ATPase/permease subunit
MKTKKALAGMWSFLDGARLFYAISLVMLLAERAASSLGAALVVRFFMDAVLSKSIGMMVDAAKFCMYVGAVMALSGGVGSYLCTVASHRASLKTREKLFDRALHGEMSYFASHPSGEMVSRLANDTETATAGLATLRSGIGEVFQLVVSLAAMLVWSWQATATILSLSVACLALTGLFARPVKRVSDEYQSQLSRVTQFASDLFSGVVTAKSFDAEDLLAERFGRVADEQRSTGCRRGAILGFETGVSNFVPGLAIAGMVAVSGVLAVRGSISQSDAVALIQLGVRVLSPFVVLGSTWVRLQENLAAADIVREALNMPVEVAVEDTTRPVSPTQGAPAVLFDAVRFGYSQSKDVLAGLSFDVSPGEKVAVVGPSGSGKSTVLKLLLRLYERGAGSIRLFGTEIDRLSLRTIRNMMSLVPQEPYLFPGSVRENISVGKPGATDDEIVAAARAANAHEFISAMPGGYSAQVDERGGNLSGGQRQRICLARAFLKNAPILLLDEPTSAVDAESERLIGEAVVRLSEGRTVVTIAHTTRMLESADRTIALGRSASS